MGPVRANTVLKWSRALQAAYERANRNGGKKCVRGVVDDKKLLTANPWKCFTWIEGDEPSIRQFSGSELVSLLDYLEARWPGVTVATALAKVFLWSWGRRMEVASLTWQSLRVVGEEYHFEVVGKWGVDKWFRIPTGLYQELLRLRTDSPYVFAAYNQQLREFYLRARPGAAEAVSTEFRPMNLADWFHNRVVDWSGSTPGGHATTHVFRKTTLQYARTGEDVSQQVANDARLGASVMMTHYAKESDPERREQSNRTYRRILAALLAISPEAAERYGYVKAAPKTTRELLAEAYAAEDWDQVARLSKELQSQRPRAS